MNLICLMMSQFPLPQLCLQCQSRHFRDLFKMETQRVFIIITSLDITGIFNSETFSTILLDIDG